MARRLTTNQEIPGSTPGVIVCFVLDVLQDRFRFCSLKKRVDQLFFLVHGLLHPYVYARMLCISAVMLHILAINVSCSRTI
jgi:hypothetical protein